MRPASVPLTLLALLLLLSVVSAKPLFGEIKALSKLARQFMRTPGMSRILETHVPLRTT